MIDEAVPSQISELITLCSQSFFNQETYLAYYQDSEMSRHMNHIVFNHLLKSDIFLKIICLKEY